MTISNLSFFVLSLPSPCLNLLNINTKVWMETQNSPFTPSHLKRLGILKKHFGVWPKTPKRFWLNASMFCYTSIHAFIYILRDKMYDLTTIRCYILLQQDVASSGETPSWNGERRKKGLPSPKLSDLQFVSLRWKEWMHLLEFPGGGLFMPSNRPQCQAIRWWWPADGSCCTSRWVPEASRRHCP